MSRIGAVHSAPAALGHLRRPGVRGPVERLLGCARPTRELAGARSAGGREKSRESAGGSGRGPDKERER